MSLIFVPRTMRKRERPPESYDWLWIIVAAIAIVALFVAIVARYGSFS